MIQREGEGNSNLQRFYSASARFVACRYSFSYCKLFSLIILINLDQVAHYCSYIRCFYFILIHYCTVSQYSKTRISSGCSSTQVSYHIPTFLQEKVSTFSNVIDHQLDAHRPNQSQYRLRAFWLLLTRPYRWPSPYNRLVPVEVNTRSFRKVHVSTLDLHPPPLLSSAFIIDYFHRAPLCHITRKEVGTLVCL